MITEQVSNSPCTPQSPGNQNNKQPYIIYVPYNINQQPSQPQQDNNQIQQHLVAKQPNINIQGDAQSDVDIDISAGNISIKNLVVELQVIKDASLKDKKILSLKVTALQLLTHLVTLKFVVLTYDIMDFRHIQYDPYLKRFLPLFYFSVICLALVIIHTFINFQKIRQNHGALISYLIFTTSYAFVWQGVFSSGYTLYYFNDFQSYYYMLDAFGVWIMYGLGQACVTYGGIIVCIIKEKKKLKYLESAVIITISNLIYTLILNLYDIDRTFLKIAFILSIVGGLYYIFILKNFQCKGYKDLKTNEYQISSILVFVQMLVPFINYDE